MKISSFVFFFYVCNFLCLFHLALRKLNNNFILNGDFIVSVYRKLIEVSGTTLEYSGSDHVTERINCSKMLHEGIELLVSKTLLLVKIVTCDNFFRQWRCLLNQLSRFKDDTKKWVSMHDKEAICAVPLKLKLCPWRFFLAVVETETD